MSGNATAAADVLTVPAGESAGEPAPTHSTTGDGFITGVEPAKSPESIRAEQQAARAAAAASQNPAPPAPAQTEGERMFSASQVEEFRSQERDKMHNRVADMETEVEKLRREREEERAALAAEQQSIEDAARLKAEDEMDVRDLLRQTREELQGEIQAARTEADTAKALLEQEQRFQELGQYRTQAIAAVSDRLVPEITDFVSGDTPEQIDASIADALERSDRIVQGFVSAQQQTVQGMKGTRTTLPSGSGPLEEQQENRQMTPEQIKALTPSEFQAMRGTLMQAGRQQFYGQR